MDCKYNIMEIMSLYNLLNCTACLYKNFEEFMH